MGKNKYTLAVLGAGTLWGFMGFFRRTLDTMAVGLNLHSRQRNFCGSAVRHCNAHHRPQGV